MRHMQLHFAGMALVISLGMILNSCGRKPTLTLRTDVEPLTRRLNLPKQIQNVRWVAVSPVQDTGSVPGRTDFYEVYAYLQMDEGEWATLNQTGGEPASRDAITIPEGAAKVIVPSTDAGNFKESEGGLRAEGQSFNAKNLVVAGDTKTEVQKAVRVGSALVLQMMVH